MTKKKKSLKVNMVLHSINAMMGIIFPLISFPYISKTIGVEGVGRYTFSSSFILYFILIAKLGIPDYAVREGAVCRNDKGSFQKFADEIFTLNVLSMAVSYICLLCCILVTSGLTKYRCLILILSVQIFLKTLGVEWIYAIYEDYIYIAIRNIIFQIISLLLLFLFVHEAKDVYCYAVITVFSCTGSNVLNYFRASSYCRVRFRLNSAWRCHIGSVFIMFVIVIATTIFENSDITILGFLTSDYHVGIYSVAVKIYTILKTLLASMVIVSIPRLSMYWGKNEKKQFMLTLTDIYGLLLTVLFPAATGIIILRKEIVLLISDITYIEATSPLFLLSIAMIFNLCGYFWARCILVPLKKERTVLLATVASAALNVILNIILIPHWSENAAAFTTISAEILYFVWCLIEGRRNIKFIFMWRTMMKIGLGCIYIVFIGQLLKSLCLNFIVYIITTILSSVLGYFLIQLFLKNWVIVNILVSIKGKVHLINH